MGPREAPAVEVPSAATMQNEKWEGARREKSKGNHTTYCQLDPCLAVSSEGPKSSMKNGWIFEVKGTKLSACHSSIDGEIQENVG